MKNTIFRRFVVSLSLAGMLLCQLGHAAAPAVRDIALPSNQVLQGQLIDVEGVAQAGTEVALIQDGKVLAMARTDAAGNFAMTGVEAGMYQLHAPGAISLCRVWAPNTAPPAAQQGILMVTSDEIVRQQLGNGGFLGHLANPWILAAIVAAAIAIPLALDDDDAS